MFCPYKCYFFMNDHPGHYPPRFPEAPLPEGRQTQPPLKVKSKNISYKKNYIDVNLNIPVLSDGPNNKNVDYINKSVENDITEFKNQIEEGAEHDAQEAKKKGKTMQPYRASNVYEITYNKNGIISLSLLYNVLLNGLNNYVKTGYTYDLNTGKALSLGDLFRPGTNYRQILNNEIRNELASKKYSPSAAASFPGVAPDQPFYLRNNSLDVFFGFNEVAPASAEIPIISIPLSRLSSVLKPRILQ